MLTPIIRRLIIGAAALVASALIAGPAVAQKTKLTVYTALENDQLEPYKQAFEAANPDVEIAWVRDSTGVITAQLLAEKDNPRADVIWGLGASSIALFDSMGMLEPYTPKGADQLKPMFHSAKNPHDLDRHGRVARGHVLQHRRGRQEEAAEARIWADLDQARLQGLDRDAQSRFVGHGLPDGLRVAPDAWARQKAWEFMDKLHQNIAVVHALRLGALRAGGEGRARDRHRLRHARRQEKTKGAPIDIIVAKEGARLGHGSHGDRQGNEEPRRGEEARRLRPRAREPTSSTASTTRSSAIPG